MQKRKLGRDLEVSAIACGKELDLLESNHGSAAERVTKARRRADTGKDSKGT